jgi:hypothetical protein
MIVVSSALSALVGESELELREPAELLLLLDVEGDLFNFCAQVRYTQRRVTCVFFGCRYGAGCGSDCGDDCVPCYRNGCSACYGDYCVPCSC